MKLEVQLRFVWLSQTPRTSVFSISAHVRIFVFRYRRNIVRRDSSVTTVTRLQVWRLGKYRYIFLPRNVQIGCGTTRLQFSLLPGGYKLSNEKVAYLLPVRCLPMRGSIHPPPDGVLWKAQHRTEETLASVDSPASHTHINLCNTMKQDRLLMNCELLRL